MEPTLLETAITNYRKLKRYEKRLLDDLLVINTRKIHAGGSIAKMPENPRDKGSIQIDNLMFSDPIVHELQITQALLGIADKFIDSLEGEDKQLILDKFIRKKSMEYITEVYAMNHMAVWRRIDTMFMTHKNT